MVKGGTCKQFLGAVGKVSRTSNTFKGVVRDGVHVLRKAETELEAEGGLLDVGVNGSQINLKRENQPLVEYMPVSSPTKCIACSLDRYRGALYPIFFTFSCVFVFISTLKDTWSEKVHESTLNEKISP